MTTILLIEDDELNQDILARRLALRNVTVIVAANGEEGLKIASDRKLDAIVTDVFLPEMDGLEVCSRLRSNPVTQEIPVVAISAHATEEARLSCLNSGADVYLSKPVNIDQLVRSLEELVADPVTFRATGQAEPSPQPVEQSEVFSPSAMLTFAERGKHSVKHYVTLYLDKIDRELAELNSAIQSGDTKRVSYLAHSGLGSSLACGCNRLGDLFRELETQAEQGQLDSAESLQSLIKDELQIVVPLLNKLAAESE